MDVVKLPQLAKMIRNLICYDPSDVRHRLKSVG